ncbi:MAG: glycosyltransferase family 4 protein [Anaerolineales bacterium]|nr:glycosyltransferase family 4 protein [Anaerolineales bacterium]
MKILYLHHGTILGGAPLSLLYLVREIERQPDVEVELACHAPTMQEFFACNLKSPIRAWENPLTFFGRYFIGYVPLDSAQRRKLFFNELRRVPCAIWRQYRNIRQIRPDLVHLNSSVMFTSALAARLAGIPIVWHVREPVQGERWKQRFSGFMIRSLAKRVIAISEVEAKHLGHDANDKVRVIYNPLNFDMLRPDQYDPLVERKKLGVDPDCKLIVSLGGAAPRKGALEQVQAMKYVDTSTRLVIAGPPLPENSADEYHQRLYQVLAELPPNKVVFTGILENVALLLAACDVLIFTGMTPHFPRPVFEAWLMKKPVIVFEMEGVSNQVADGETGMIVRELTGHALGIALAKLLKDSAAMKRMGEAGRHKAEEKCNPVSVARQVLSVYHEVLGS